jgi:hypothetical protein
VLTARILAVQVHRAVWVPREHVPRLLDTHRLHDGVVLEGVEVVGEHQVEAPVRLSEIQAGLGEGHKFALRAFIESR